MISMNYTNPIKEQKSGRRFAAPQYLAEPQYVDDYCCELA